jgi:prepilin-type N-terminal cleavage/methylation domain-containing protein
MKPVVRKQPAFFVKTVNRDKAGFTLVEVSLVLVVLGIIAAAAASAYLGLFSASRTKLNSDSSLALLSGAVVAFAKTHNRLPCPDNAGNGSEGTCSSGPIGPTVGWFPYLSVGLPAPNPRERAIYGVYRATGTDLALAEEHGGDAAGSATYADGADFLRALQAAAGKATTSNQIYITGDGAATGTESCAGNIRSNPAYVIVATGEDRDGDGKMVDGIHNTLPGSGHCFASPTRAADTNFDDRTLAVSFYALMAKLNNQL